uniref:carboxylesterase n=1 Tax=Calliphora stygia TaxID=145453 RepID=A0A068FBT0_CALSG|nr:esterase [Calliphora stygia]
MEMNVGVLELFKLLGKLVVYKIEEKRLATSEYEIITTIYGKVRGMQRRNAYDGYGNYYAFEGIPYAKPPLGDLRFRAPQPPEPWEDVKDCLYYKSKPVQKDFIKRITIGSEDCLYLNVYAKNLCSEKPLPVMVWIYGGGFQIGEASREIYSPDYFMQKDVILVTLAYRLGALGFLSLNDPDLQVPGNAGIKDQVMALKWIKQNIEYFNGDPNNITLFGESAGAGSTHLLMLTPQTKGLFHKAILQSGSALCNWVNTPPRDWGYKLACTIGYKGNNNDKEVYRFLAKQDGKKLACKDTVLLSRQERFENLLFAFAPVVEPYASDTCIANRPFKELMASAWSNEIPVIVGGTSYEGLFHYATVMKNHFMINELTDCVNLLPDDIIAKHSPEELKIMGSKLKLAYFGNKIPSVKETLFEYMDLMSYRTFWHGIFRFIKARSAYAKQAPTYSYVFDFDSDFFNHFRVLNCGKSMRGVSHGDDVSYLFYNVVAEKLLPTSGEFKCIQRMLGMWYNFALTSNPNCKEIEQVCWQPVGHDTDLQKPIKILNISDELEFKDIPFHRKLQLWNSFYTKESLY